MERLRVVEPFRTVFYTPHYLAIGLGLFEAEGLAVEHTTATTPNGVSRALFADEADLGLSGPMRALSALDRGEGRLLCIAEVNQRAGFFLLGRPPARDVAWRDLVGRRVLVFAEAPTPRLCLEYLLERHGVSPGAVDLVTEVPTARAVEWFRDGRGDFLLQPEPVVGQLLATEDAYLAASLGAALGPIAFSAYLASPRGLAERPMVGGAAVRALYRAQRWLHGHSAEEIAAGVAWAFPELDILVLAAAIRRYLVIRTWAPDPVLRRQGFDALQEILLSRGFLRRSHAYHEVVDNALAEAAVQVMADGAA